MCPSGVSARPSAGRRREGTSTPFVEARRRAGPTSSQHRALRPKSPHRRPDATFGSDELRLEGKGGLFLIGVPAPRGGESQRFTELLTTPRICIHAGPVFDRRPSFPRRIVRRELRRFVRVNAVPLSCVAVGVLAFLGGLGVLLDGY